LRGVKQARADTVIDAKGKLLFAGFIDAHVHMRDPGFTHKEDFSSGTVAAACAGITTVMCMPNTTPAVDSVAGFDAAREAGANRAFVDFTLQGAITRSNLGHLSSLWKAGITSFETQISNGPEEARLDDPNLLLEAFTRVAEVGGIVGSSADCQPLLDRAIRRLKDKERRMDFLAFMEAREPVGEAIGIATILEAANATGAKVILRQITTRRGFEILRREKRSIDKKRIVAVEVTPHHLHLNSSRLERMGALAMMSPPLRSRNDCRAAVQALSDGTVDFVGSDHAPHTLEEKQASNNPWGVPGGTPGLDTISASVLDLALRGKISLSRIAEVLGSGPADLFGLGGTKGRLKKGVDGDLVLVDPDAVRTVTPKMIHSKAARTPFEGSRLRGWPVLTVLRGEIIAENGKLIEAPPRGRFIRRQDQLQ
jgi:dihydroorotase (multifunctional complex type)